MILRGVKAKWLTKKGVKQSLCVFFIFSFVLLRNAFLSVRKSNVQNAKLVPYSKVWSRFGHGILAALREDTSQSAVFLGLTCW